MGALSRLASPLVTLGRERPTKSDSRRSRNVRSGSFPAGTSRLQIAARRGLRALPCQPCQRVINSSGLSASACTSAWVGGLDTAQTRCSLNSQPSTLNQSGELAADFARDQRGVIGRQAGIEDRGGHKQSLVCFPSPQFYAWPPASTGRGTARALIALVATSLACRRACRQTAKESR